MIAASNWKRKNIKVDERKTSRQSQIEWELGSEKGTAEGLYREQRGGASSQCSLVIRFLFLHCLKWLCSFVPLSRVSRAAFLHNTGSGEDCACILASACNCS